MKEIYNWLMISNAWMKYIVKTQLLNESISSHEAINDPYINEIIKRLKDPDFGIKALIDHKTSYLKMGNAFWDLYFLADLGFSGEELGMSNLLERIITMHNEDFLYIFQENQRINHLCIPPLILTSLCKMGYAKDERLIKYKEYILSRQRNDGGWHCSINKDVGNKDDDAPSCPMATINILLFLAEYQIFDKTTSKAIDFLLNHWKRRSEPWRPYGFGIGSQFMRLKYPTVKYGVLRFIDTLSLFPYAYNKKEFREIMKIIHAKAKDNKFFAESISRSYAEFDFGQTKEPSRFITFIIERINKRING